MKDPSELSADQIDKLAWKALVDVTNKYGRECTKVISQPRTWAGFSEIRDIVNTGQLRASQKIDYIPAELITEVSYNTEYAAAVHNGATIEYSNGNTRTIPARPWLTIAERSININREMEVNLVKKIKKLL